MKRRQFIKSTAPVATIGVAGCTSGGSSNGDSDSNGDSGGGNQNEGGNNQERPPGTRWYDSATEIGVMEGVEAEMDSIGNMYIRGTAKNFSNSDYSYVQLSFSVIDDTGAKLASGLANTNGLSAGQRWRFEALAASAEGASAYKLTDVTAY